MNSTRLFSRVTSNRVLASGALIAVLLGACESFANNGSNGIGQGGATTASTTVAGGGQTQISFTPGAPSASPCVGVQDPTTAVTRNLGPFTQAENVIDANKNYCAILTTNRGRIVLELFPKASPINVNNFVFLARQGYYDGVTWHRVLSGFMAQTGDPTGTGAGSPGYNIPLEVDSTLRYDRPYLVGVARSQARDSAGSQFFITYAAADFLNPGVQGDGYTIIGQVVEGQQFVNQIRLRDPEQSPNFTGDPLVSVRIIEL